MNLGNKNTGIKGEDLTTEWLINNDFEIIARNHRYKHSEVDIIASKNNVLHFVEVKTRTNEVYGFPEESVGTKKMNALKKAAAAYVEENPQWKYLQFDVMAVTLSKNNAPAFFFIEDVFF
ncbi:MAG: YraN family protein [Chitinophagaceae bacterium]|nr:YraN family protein [Chitinophagaceae bacterium]MCW5906151.1 YraN family protein [Chitinophagaceae bacterium]